MRGGQAPEHSPPFPQAWRSEDSCSFLRGVSYGLAPFLRPLPFGGNILHLFVESSSQRKSVLDAFSAGRPVGVWGPGELRHQCHDQWAWPWGLVANKAHLFLLHFHIVLLQWYTLTRIKYRMFLKLMGRGTNILTIHLWDHFFFLASSPKSFRTSSYQGHMGNLLLSLSNFTCIGEEYFGKGKGIDASSQVPIYMACVLPTHGDSASSFPTHMLASPI